MENVFNVAAELQRLIYHFKQHFSDFEQWEQYECPPENLNERLGKGWPKFPIPKEQLKRVTFIGFSLVIDF